jgi:PKD repeat protein
MKLKIIFAILAIVMLSGCLIEQPFERSNETESGDEKVEKKSPKPVVKKAVQTPEEVVKEEPKEEANVELKEITESRAGPKVSAEDKEGLPVKEIVEGELVDFPNLKAVDPDGDPITYTFSSLLNEQGKWQTEVGDVGEYIVSITASDGKNTAKQEVLVVVRSKNLPPKIQINEKLVFKEGETVKLEPVVTDPDGDDIIVKYFGWMSSDTKETTFKDAGTYKVTIEATDGISTVSKEIAISISNVNRVPVLKEISDVFVKEGGLVEIVPIAIDDDGDQVTYDFDLPLNEVGKWQTEIGDAGTHQVKIVASDGRAKDTVSVKITVEPKNRPPTIAILGTIEAKEGETVVLNPVVNDPEGDEFTVKYEGWMTSKTRLITYEDAGTHTVTIVAEDTGGHKTEKDVVISVEDVNRAPVFSADAFN